MQAYLDANAEAFRVPARRQYAWIRVDRASIRASIDPAEETLKAYYQEHGEEFRVPEAALVNDFFAPVADDQPTTAAEMLLAEARMAAEADPSADWEAIRDTIREKNPDYRFYFRDVGAIEAGPETEEVHGRDYAEAAMELEESGLSETVKSPLGLHLIRRTGTRESAIPAFEDVQAEVRAAWVDSEVERAFKEQVDLMRSEMGNYGTLKEFAEEHGFEYGVTGMIDADEAVLPGVADITRHRAYLRTLTPGIISETIPLGERSLGLQVLEEQASYIPALDEVRDGIAATLKIEKALERAEADARAALEKAAGAPDLLTVARDLGTTTSLTPPLTRGGISRGAADSKLEGPLLNFENQSGGAGAGTMGVSAYSPAPGADPDGYALWRVRDIESPVREEFLKVRHRFAAGRQNELENILIEEWLADERSRIEYEVYGVTVN
jgi:peptidyl-prolyl cis-trans isomerase D